MGLTWARSTGKFHANRQGCRSVFIVHKDVPAAIISGTLSKHDGPPACYQDTA